jgi:hypothetical protein
MSEDQERAQQATEAHEKAGETVRELEDDPPKNLDDWPKDRAKYRTLGGPEGESGYDEGPTSKLGPSELRYHEDGSVSISGEKVDNPEDYKADEPLPRDFAPDPRDREEEDAKDGEEDG